MPGLETDPTLRGGREFEARRALGAVKAALLGADMPPVRLGRYPVVRVLGAGAMGTVYLARDPELDREVAIRIVRTGTGAPSEREQRTQRLLREARSLALLSHPNVVQVFDAGRVGADVYIVMELLRGRELGEIWTHGP